ncbi:glycosyltransferase [Clostridium sp. FP1]|uniref:glycosyltransferase n=1 Tax=Clostridium sp. FP1 TaxID=2724076 RepID=UPI0013E9240F|nr:glycosyltransferase [Clostridium sp. FP1]MBZ9634148.1 glycosyltransferase [Clostridium sp. FP1]
MNNKKICFICCVNDETMYQKSMVFINQLEIPESYESENIRIENANCITKAYNEAMKKSDAKYKIYFHEDAFILNKNFIQDTINIFNSNKKIGMIGIAGAKIIPQSGIWWESNLKYGNYNFIYKGKENFIEFNKIKNYYEDVKCIDGTVMVTQYDVPWRDDAFKGGNFYDISQSLEFLKKGYELVVARQFEPWCLNYYRNLNNEEQYQMSRIEFLNEYSKDMELITYNGPSVKEELEKYIKNDLRESINKILQKLKNNNTVFVISHSDYRTILGGTEKVIYEQQKLFLDKKISYIQIFPYKQIVSMSNEPDLQMIALNVDSNLIGYFTISQLKIMLFVIQKLDVNIMKVHIHHLLGFDISSIEKLLEYIKADIKFFLHDYYSICPHCNLLKDDIYYCGDSHHISNYCSSCKYGKERVKHFEKINSFFYKFNMIFIAPSEVAKNIWVKFFPELRDRVYVIPHQVLVGEYYKKNLLGNKTIKVAYVGSQQENKGWAVWRNFVKQNKYNYDIYHFGLCCEKLSNVTNILVSFIEDGEGAMTEALKKYNIDIVILWSICPETYSFTYFESYCAGCFVITNPFSGNVAQQVIKNGNGVVLQNETDLNELFKNPDDICNLINKTTGIVYPVELKVNSCLIDEVQG